MTAASATPKTKVPWAPDGFAAYPRAAISTEDPRLTSTHVLTILALCLAGDTATGVVGHGRSAHRKVGARVGLSPSAIGRSIKDLVAWRYLEVLEAELGETVTYKLLPPPTASALTQAASDERPGSPGEQGPSVPAVDGAVQEPDGAHLTVTGPPAPPASPTARLWSPAAQPTDSQEGVRGRPTQTYLDQAFVCAFTENGIEAPATELERQRWKTGIDSLSAVATPAQVSAVVKAAQRKWSSNMTISPVSIARQWSKLDPAIAVAHHKIRSLIGDHNPGLAERVSFGPPPRYSPEPDPRP